MYVVDLSLQHVKPLCNGRHPCYTSYPKESPQATNEPIENYIRHYSRINKTIINVNMHIQGQHNSL